MATVESLLTAAGRPQPKSFIAPIGPLKVEMIYIASMPGAANTSDTLDTRLANPQFAVTFVSAASGSTVGTSVNAQTGIVTLLSDPGSDVPTITLVFGF